MTSSILLALLICLPSLALGASVMYCTHGNHRIQPGESYVFEENCARHNCICDPTKSSSEMCKSTMIGCLSGSTCYKAGDPATVTGSGGTTLHCECQVGSGGSYQFVSCRSETCKDSRTGEEKKKGEQVTISQGGVTYICTCAGVDGYQNCRTEESIANEGKCLDQVTGGYVNTGEPVKARQGGTVLYCTCAGTNYYTNCRVNFCKDVSGEVKQPGEKVTVRYSGQLLVCDCAGVEGYKNCVNKADFDNAGKCKDVNGNYANVGQRYRVMHNGVLYECTCDGNNRGRDCSVVG